MFIYSLIHFIFLSALSAGYRILFVSPAKKVRPFPKKECAGYGAKRSDGEALTLEIWLVRSAHSLPLIPNPL